MGQEHQDNTETKWHKKGVFLELNLILVGTQTIPEIL